MSFEDEDPMELQKSFFKRILGIKQKKYRIKIDGKIPDHFLNILQL